MVEIKITECPFCHGKEFVEGYQDAYGAITGVNNIWSGVALYHTICRNCGSVVHSYVKNPEKILKRKDRR